MDRKWALSSQTVHGLVVAILGLVVAQLGVPGMDDAEIERTAGLLMELGGIVWAGYGRWRAKGPLTASRAAAKNAGPEFAVQGDGDAARIVRRDQSGWISPWVAALIVAMCALVAGLWITTLQGCAGRELTPDQAARATAGEIANAYLAADAAYARMLAEAQSAGDVELAETLTREVAPALDQAKRYTVLVGRVAVCQALVAAYERDVDAWETSTQTPDISDDPTTTAQPPRITDYLTPARIADLNRAAATALGSSVGGGASEVMLWLGVHADSVTTQALELVELAQALLAPLHTDPRESR